MVARALFLSSSFSIGSTAQQGRAVRLYSNLAYLTQTPRRGYKTQYTRSFHLRSDFFVGIGILSVTLKTPKLKCFCLVFLRYSEVRFKKKVTSGCRAQYLKKRRIYFRQWTQGTELLLAESTAVAEEGILLVVVDGAALVALEHVLPAVAAHPGVGRHRGRAPGTLQRLTHRLIDTHS